VLTDETAERRGTRGLSKDGGGSCTCTYRVLPHTRQSVPAGVGVEVPMGDTWPGDKLDACAWHDGTWGGVRYFDIGGSMYWDFGDDVRTMRWKRLDGLSTVGKGGRSFKRDLQC
jgi:hypothetical protein